MRRTKCGVVNCAEGKRSIDGTIAAAAAEFALLARAGEEDGDLDVAPTHFGSVNKGCVIHKTPSFRDAP